MVQKWYEFSRNCIQMLIFSQASDVGWDTYLSCWAAPASHCFHSAMLPQGYTANTPTTILYTYKYSVFHFQYSSQ